MKQATTTYKNGKPFAWSYSKIKNYAVCPKRHYHVDIAKDYKEDPSDALVWGNMVHDALHRRLALNDPLPERMELYEPWAAAIDAAPGELSTELKFALTDEFQPTTFFDKKAWYRGICDVLVVNGPVALAVDWKLGKIIEDSVQLGLMSACIFAHYPEVQAIRTEFAWLKDDATTRVDFTRADMPALWNEVLPRVAVLKEAAETLTYPPKPSGMCKRWCPVTSCPHHGE